MAPPSDWLLRWAHCLPAHAQVLDLACGSGRHVRWLAAQGHAVTAVDRDADALADLADLPAAQVERLAADLEQGPWPLAGRQFDAVLVTNYLWRPRVPELLRCVKPGGWLIYETFAVGQETLGRPSRPEFLLRPGELLDWLRPRSDAPAEWRVVAFEDTLLAAPERFAQRILGQRVTAG